MTSTAVAQAVLVSRDLFFVSKITGTASALGLRMDVVSDGATAKDKVHEISPTCLILDLADPALDPAEVLTAIPSSSTRPFVIAFGSHVATARLETARQAGCDLVLPRSRFSTELAEILKTHALHREHEGEDRPANL